MVPAGRCLRWHGQFDRRENHSTPTAQHCHTATHAHCHTATHRTTPQQGSGPPPSPYLSRRGPPPSPYFSPPYLSPAPHTHTHRTAPAPAPAPAPHHTTPHFTSSHHTTPRHNAPPHHATPHHSATPPRYITALHHHTTRASTVAALVTIIIVFKNGRDGANSFEDSLVPDTSSSGGGEISVRIPGQGEGRVEGHGEGQGERRVEGHSDGRARSGEGGGSSSHYVAHTPAPTIKRSLSSPLLRACAWIV